MGEEKYKEKSQGHISPLKVYLTYMFNTVNNQSFIVSQLFWRMFKIEELPTYEGIATLSTLVLQVTSN